MKREASPAERLSRIRSSIPDPVELAAARPGVLQNSRILTEFGSLQEIRRRAEESSSSLSSNFSSSFQGQFASQS